MAIRWFDGFKNFKPSDLLNRLNIESDGTLTVDGKPIDTGSSNGGGNTSTGGGNELTLTVKDYFSGSTTVTKTYTDNMMGFDIANDGSSDLTFSINGLTLTVKAGEVFSDTFDPFTSVTITTSVAFRAYVKAPYNSTPVADTTPPTITASPVGGTYGSTQTITLLANESTSIYYTLDGSTPTTSSTKYSSPISISTTTTIKYFGVDTAGNQSTVQSATYTIDTVAPNDVTNLTVGTVTETSIPLIWTLSTSTDVAKYEVSYMASGNTTYTVASNQVNSSSTSYTINGLTQNTQYTARVVAIDQVGNRSTGTTAIATTAVSVDTTPPNDVTNLTASNIASTSLALNWTASTSTDIASYDVYQGATLLGNTTNTIYNVSSLSASTSYTFKVVSKDTSGNVSAGVTVTIATSSPQPVDTTPPIISVSPSGGTYTSTQSVSLSANETATIYYTTDGTTPTTGSAVYSSPISVTGNTTLEYFGVDTAGNTSTVQSSIYNIQLAELTAMPVTGTYNNIQNVQLSSSSLDNTIYYTVDGSAPTVNSNAYSIPIPVTSSKNINYMAVNSSGIQTSTETVSYTINQPTSFASVTSGQAGYTIHDDYHTGAIKILVDVTSPKFFLAIRDTDTAKYGVWCDGTKIYVGWVDNTTLRLSLATLSIPQENFYVEVDIPQIYQPGFYDNFIGYIRGYVWGVSASKPTSYNLSAQLQSPSTKWAASTTKSVGNIIIPTTANGFYYKVTTAGTTGATEPTWPTTEGNTITDGTVVWTTYKVVPQILTGKVSLYSFDGTPVNILGITINDGLNTVNPYRNQAYYVGRWFNSMGWSNIGSILGEEMATINGGSEILAQFTGTTTLKLTYGNSTDHSLAYSIDGAPLTRMPVNASSLVSGATYSTNTVTIATGLDSTQTHTVRIIVSALDTAQDKWTYQTASFRFKGFSGDDSNFVIHPWHPNRKKILFIGDSITDGLNIYSDTQGGGNAPANHAAEMSYPKLASDALNVIGHQHAFGSVGITKVGLEGVPKAIDATRYWYNTRNEMYEEPDLIVIAHHVNGDSDPDSDFISGYNDLINWFIAKWGNTKPIILLEVSGYGTHRLLLPQIADGFTNVNFIGTVQEGITIETVSDGIHPDTTGHQAISDHFVTRVKQIVGDSFFTV